MRLRVRSLLFLLVPLLAHAQFPFLRSLEVRSGQGRPQITSLVQDDLGLVWTGSDAGILRTDGERVDAMFRAENGEVSALFAADKAVLAAFTTGHVLRFQAGRMDTLITDTALATAPVRSLGLLPDGTLCLGTYGAGVWFIHDGVVTRVDLGQGLPDDHVNDIVVLDAERVVAATDQGLAVVSSKGVKYVLDGSSGAPDNLVLAVAVGKQGSVFAGTDAHGVFRWEPGTRSTVVLDAHWTHGPVTDILVDEERVWVGTERAGVVVLDLEANGTYQATGDEHHGRITGLWRDQEGAVWWCNGSERIHRADPAVLFIPEHDGVDLRSVTAICMDDDQRIWVATPTGIHHHASTFAEGLQFVHVPISIDHRTPVVSLAASRSGTVWAATFGSGVMAITPKGEVRRYTTQHGLRNDNVLAVRTMGDTVWFATLSGACMWDGRTFHSIEGAAGFTFDVLPLPNGRALVATDGQGVLAYGDGRVSALRTEARTFYSLLRMDSGAAWAMAPVAGLCLVDGGPAQCIGEGRAVFAGDLFALATSQGRLLAFGSAGTVAFDPLTGGVSDLTGRIGTAGVAAELNTVAHARDGSVWFACDKGLIRLQLTERHFEQLIPIVITEVLVSGEPKPLNDAIHTAHDRNDVTIRFTGLYYPDPAALRFEYRFGTEGDVLRTRDRELAFVGLGPGTHQIQLRAFIGEVGAAEGWRTVTIIVDTPWWRDPWILALILAAVAAVVVLVVRGRERRMRERDRLEQEKVRFQLEALRSQVDPHFLFNSFNTLVALIETDQEKAVEHVEELSTFFRSILLVRDKDLIPITEEMELLRSYFDLEVRRFGKAIALTIDISGTQDRWIVPLTLQLLVENALKHNAATVQEPLVVTVRKEGEELVVRNPLRPRAGRPRSTEFGLDSIVKRYAAITHRPIVVAKEEATFTVRIPLLKSDEHLDR